MHTAEMPGEVGSQHRPPPGDPPIPAPPQAPGAPWRLAGDPYVGGCTRAPWHHGRAGAVARCGPSPRTMRTPHPLGSGMRCSRRSGAACSDALRRAVCGARDAQVLGTVWSPLDMERASQRGLAHDGRDGDPHQHEAGGTQGSRKGHKGCRCEHVGMQVCKDVRTGANPLS